MDAKKVRQCGTLAAAIGFLIDGTCRVVGAIIEIVSTGETPTLQNVSETVLEGFKKD